ncbi:MAG: hemerythrin domain-containing protein [Myxococcales bacterium]|nr:hemerythrin domain-containing protein [Myxococcales bacterium]
MQRDRRLTGLSSEHHQSLVIARRLVRESGAWTAADGEEFAARFAAELEPHFRVEEQVLLPALREAGEVALVARTEADHAFFRAKLPAVRAGDGAAARALGERLGDHVRFEERELFPACEARLDDAVLDEAFRRAPK